MSDKHRTIIFGKDGYEDAVKQIGDIGDTLGLSDFAQFTAPPPPGISESTPAKAR
jgi:hypothetical protein